MTPERFRQIRNVFEAALEREADARLTFLEEACKGDDALREEVSKLLAEHGRPAGILDQVPADPTRMEGRCIDHYMILRELGRGGMASVYLAVRTDDVHRIPVALKVVRPEVRSAEVIKRFHQEREILAGLDHPNIARLLDGGTTPDGLPYFVLDYVAGHPIDAWCDDRRLSVDDRLKLFESVCSAVDYAHRRGVAHRDLKPANIFVNDEGGIKLLDFGIAKLLRTSSEDATAYMTRTGMRLMTPAYASPEQAKGEAVGKASDIYSLGVVLYEILTGHRPYQLRQRMVHEVLRVICQEEPTRPSVVVNEVDEEITPQTVSRMRQTTPPGLRRKLLGDLDNILLTAMRKEPEKRYGSAKDFSEDLLRHLEGLPIKAHGVSPIFRAEKLLRQYRWWVLAVLFLAAGWATGAVTIQPIFAFFAVMYVMLGAAAYRVMSLECGGEISGIAKRTLFFFMLVLGAVMFFLSAVLVGNRLILDLIHVTRPFLDLRSYWNVFLAALIAANSAHSAVLLARWPLRKRWGGRLLANVSRPKTPSFLPFQIPGLLAGSVLMLIAVLIEKDWKELTWVVPLILTAVLQTTLFLITWEEVEVRAKGILDCGHLMRWSSIKSYSWEPPKNGIIMLKVTRVTRAWISPWRPIAIPQSKKEDVEAILDRQLSVWPGETTNMAGDQN